MSTTVADIRTGLAANITSNITGAACTGYMLASGNPPMFEIELDQLEYDQTMARGLVKYTMIVRGLCALTSDQGSQMLLDSWMQPAGSSSVKVAIESDRTLGGKAHNLRVVSVGRPQIYSAQAGQGAFYGAEWQVEIFTAGT